MIFTGFCGCFFLEKKMDDCQQCQWQKEKQRPGTISDLGGGNSNIFYVHHYLGKIPILTNIFQMG